MRNYSDSEDENLEDEMEEEIEYKSDSESDNNYNDLEEDMNDKALLIFIKNQLEKEEKRKKLKEVGKGRIVKEIHDPELDKKKKKPKKKRTAPKKKEIVEEVKNDKPIEVNNVDAKPIEGEPVMPLYN